MQDVPHRYAAVASAAAEGDVVLESEGLTALATAPPVQFGGAGDRWSPETLLVAAVADCFSLSFRAIARASKLPWTRLRCRAEGTLDRVERTLRFTEIAIRAELVLPEGGDTDKARRLLEKAEASCLISNSLTAKRTLDYRVEIG